MPKPATSHRIRATARPGPRAPQGLPGVAIIALDRRVRDSLASLLEATGSIRIVGAASDPQAVRVLLASTQPDVIVLDPRLGIPGEGDLVALLRTSAPGARILVVEWDGERHLSLLARGADGLIDANATPTELLAVLAGPVPRPSSLAATD